MVHMALIQGADNQQTQRSHHWYRAGSVCGASVFSFSTVVCVLVSSSAAYCVAEVLCRSSHKPKRQGSGLWWSVMEETWWQEMKRTHISQSWSVYVPYISPLPLSPHNRFKNSFLAAYQKDKKKKDLREQIINVKQSVLQSDRIWALK